MHNSANFKLTWTYQLQKLGGWPKSDMQITAHFKSYFQHAAWLKIIKCHLLFENFLYLFGINLITILGTYRKDWESIKMRKITFVLWSFLKVANSW